MKKRFLIIGASLPAQAFRILPAFAYEESAGGGIQDPAAGWVHLFNEVLIDITIMGIIFAAVALYFMVKYRRRHPDQVGDCKKLSAARMWGWVLIPTFVFLADDFFLAANTWSLWNVYRRAPEGAYEIEVTAQMWSWNFRYAKEGGLFKESYNELYVPEGTPIVLRMTSADVIHSLYLPDFKVKEDCMPGRVTYYWFYPKKAGEHVLTCAEYCGTMHSGMHGKVIVLPKEKFENWLKEGA